MAIKEFTYQIKENEKPHFDKIKDDKDISYINTRKWKGKQTKGNVDSYFISPGFYVELCSNTKYSIEAKGNEKKEKKFRKNLANKLGLNFKDLILTK